MNINMKKICVYIFCCCTLFFPACAQPASTMQTDDAMVIAFQALGAKLTETRLAAWRPLAEEMLPIETMEQVAAEIADSLSLKQLRPYAIRERNWQSYQLDGKTDQSSYQILLQTSELQTYLIVNSTSPAHIRYFPSLRAQTINAAGEGAELNCLMVGELDGGYNSKELKKRFATAFAAAGIKKVEANGDDSYFSQTGYLEGIAPALRSGKKKYNIQLAASYDEGKGVTMVYLGTPLIYSDY